MASSAGKKLSIRISWSIASCEQVLDAQIAYTTFANLVANVAGTPIDAAFAVPASA